jgi:hypothetical protein
MTNLKWYVLTLLVGLGLGAWVSYKLLPAPEPVVVERVVEGKREVVTVEKTVEKIVKPDGTVIERTKENAKTDKKETTAKAPVLVPKASYSLGLNYLPSVSAPPSWRDVELTAGARLGQSDAWAIVEYDVKHKQVSLGIRYEF